MIRLGILGTANIATSRAAPLLATLDGVEVRAIASRRSDTAVAAAAALRALDLPGSRETAGYGDYRALIADPQIDAVYIPLPTALRACWVRAALGAGKHVLAEKSLAEDLGQVADLVALAREQGLCLMENFTFVHHPVHETVRSLLDSGAIGAIRNIHAEFGIPPRLADDIRYRQELGGGSLLDVGAYPLRLLGHLFPQSRWTVGSAVLGVDSRSGVDTRGSAHLWNQDLVSATVAFGFDHGYRNQYSLWGSEGSIRLVQAFTPRPAAELSVEITTEGRHRCLVIEPADQFRDSLSEFVAAISDGRRREDFYHQAVSQATVLDNVATHAVRGQVAPMFGAVPTR